MEITFDISKEELPIFLAEVDEHLEILDNTLLRIQREENNSELIQTVFRSAHTIKGMSGMIGHRRMTDVTHALENVLDRVRKDSIRISTRLINLCLEAVDYLRLLRDEVATAQESDVNIDEIVLSLKNLAASQEVPAEETAKIRSPEVPEASPSVVKASNQADVDNEVPDTNGARGRTLQLQAKIDIHAMASAARAFQLMMAIQDFGEIQSMKPTQQEIETASSVGEFTAQILTDQSFEKISAELSKISDVDEISIDGKVISSNGSAITKQPEQTVKTEKNLSLHPKEDNSNPAPTASERRTTDPAGRRIGDLTLRMNVERIDNLMNLVGELIIDRNHLHQLRSQIAAAASSNGNVDQLFETVTHLGRITDQLQEEVMSIRMLPIGSVFNKFPRMVHDMSHKVNKKVSVVVHGEETEMDRSMIDEIYDPLIHLIRNSVDHGIEFPEQRLATGKPEFGTITLTARHEQGRIILTAEDDGAGIDGGKLRKKAIQKGLISVEEAAALTEQQSIDLMFMPGLSTVEKVTEFSGRGVGLDIVKTNIQRVNGSIQVETKIGQGTQFEIILPLTLAIVPSLLVGVQKSAFAVPMVMITETLRLDKAEIKHIGRKPAIVLRGNVLMLIPLSDIFNLSHSEGERKHLFVVVI